MDNDTEYLTEADGEVMSKGTAQRLEQTLARNKEELQTLRSILDGILDAFAAEWGKGKPICTCLPNYRAIPRDDPSCLYHISPDLWDALEAAANRLSHDLKEKI
jgi:hypothetical protein